jgi:signal transduction histidine kinase
MKPLFVFLALLCGIHSGFSQNSNRLDSLKKELRLASADSVRFLIAGKLSAAHLNADSSAYYSKLADEIATRANHRINYANQLGSKGWQLINQGEYALAKATYDLAFEIAENPDNEQFWRFSIGPYAEEKRLYVLANLHFNYGHLMGAAENRQQRVAEYRKTYQIASTTDDVLNSVYALAGLAWVHLQNSQLDSARYYIQRAIKVPPHLYNSDNYSTLNYINGSVAFQSRQYDLALKAFLTGKDEAIKENSTVGLAINYLGLSKAYRAKNKLDSSYVCGLKALGLFKKLESIEILSLSPGDAYENLYELFQKKQQTDSALHYLELTKTETDKYHHRKLEQLANFQQVLLKEQAQLKDLEREKIQTEIRIRTYSFLITLILFVSIGALLYRNNRQKQEANTLLQEQKAKVEQTLSDLRTTQAQLIQKEKLASLGELTAGIAHEIQNPLNFVNNFSEVSAELVDELKEEAQTGRTDEVLALAEDLTQNLQKIRQHGGRASAIVRGMLEHSRASTGERQPTDLNALADEYLRLAYHGLRANDKSFNAMVNTDFEATLPTVNVVPGEIGRVLLNLLNNAFYAVAKRAGQGESGYEPSVTLRSRSEKGHVLLEVADNGTGMPEAVRAKVFQPFFTTKPTGEGTGLGLSLSYDIVTNGHGGTLTVESTEGEGTTFTVRLPMTQPS